MTIVKTSTYEPRKRASADENGILFLLKDVKEDIIDFGGLEDLPIKDVLYFIDCGKYEVLNIRLNRLDLSAAERLVNEYRRNSEGGCQSCGYKRVDKPLPDGGREYCGLSEISDLLGEGKSPRLQQCWEKGCEDREPILPPLNDVLARIKE